MELQLLILANGDQLIAYADELPEEPSCNLYRPHTIGGKTKLTLAPWPPHSDDEHILFKSSALLTVCSPNEKVSAAYTAKVKAPEVTPKPVQLNEDEQVPNEYLDAIDDEYEPRYIEE